MKWGYDFHSTQFVETATITSTAQEAEWGVAEWGVDEWGSIIDISPASVNGGGSGQVLQFGFEAQINDKEVSIQKIDIFVKNGRI